MRFKWNLWANDTCQKYMAILRLNIYIDIYKHARLLCVDIPLPNASVDLVVSFETIEHLSEHAEMMQEI